MQSNRPSSLFPIFCPSRWPLREEISRCAALVIVIGFIIQRIVQFNQFPQTWSAAERFYSSFSSPGGSIYSPAAIATLWGIKLTGWLIETGILLGYFASYISRAKAVAIADGFMETAFPIIIAGIPILISMTPYTLPHWAPLSSSKHIYYYLIIMSLIVLGGLINLVGLFTLRRAFTIMTEARALITKGIFRWIRHPLYSGHFIMFIGSLLLRFHLYTIAMYLLFVVGQVIRAKKEERKLENVFPEYASYRTKTGMFFPRIFFPRTAK